MEEHRDQHLVRTMCHVLEVSTSGFYSWRGRPQSRRDREDLRLLVLIRAIFQESRCSYGSPRVYWELRENGERCGESRVARLMHEDGLFARVPRAFRITTDSTHDWPVEDNLLDRQFQVDKPNQVWCSDITYIPTGEGWLYLAVVLDLYSRRVVGWAMRESIDRRLVLAAFDMAEGRRHIIPGLLHHSDRGSQYASCDYRELLDSVDALCSMSRKGNCWDNAVVESFFATIKRELVSRLTFETRQEARDEIFDYIEIFYNRKRRHSTLGYMSPADFEDRHTAA